jgi:hypothetical protein
MVQQRLEEDKDEGLAPGAEEEEEEDKEDKVEEWRQKALCAQRLKTVSHTGPLALPYTLERLCTKCRCFWRKIGSRANRSRRSFAISRRRCSLALHPPQVVN